MPAFTHLCKKVNISLFDDTITIYPKILILEDPTEPFLILQLLPPEDLFPIEVINLIKSPKELGNAGCVHSDDINHKNYHQDQFNSDEGHFHIRYSKTIDLPKLQEILSVFVKFNVITTEEKASFLTAYQEVASNNLLVLSNTAVNTIIPMRETPQEKANYLQLTEQLKLLKEKAGQLKDNNYTDAARVADALHGDLESALASYKKNKNTATYALFKKECVNAISKARPKLEIHYGWKMILSNILYAITGLCVFYVIAGLINLKVNKQFLFFNHTADSVERVNRLEKLVLNHPAPAP